MSCPLLDNLFSWAAQQPQFNTVIVRCELVSNTSTFQGRDYNLASYAEGTLSYVPGQGKPYFESESPLVQYFSDRRYPGNFLPGGPFDANNTDPLQLTIAASSGSYTVTLHSSKWNFTETFVPQCQDGVIFGSVSGTDLIVISLCQRESYHLT